MIYEAIRARLLATANVTAIVGARIYAVRMPDNATLPVITMQVAATTHEESMTGASGLAQVFMQIDSWASDLTTVRDLAEKVRLALEGFRGTSGGYEVQGILGWQDSDLFDDDTQIYHVSSLCRVWHAEAQPS